MRALSIKKGDLYFADLSPVTGSEQGGVRPVLVVQNDVGNKHSPTVICAAITTIDKRRLKERIGTIDKTRLPEVNEALSVSLGIDQHSFF